MWLGGQARDDSGRDWGSASGNGEFEYGWEVGSLGLVMVVTPPSC